VSKPGVRAGFSASIDLKRIERESRRLLAIGFLLGVVFHLTLGMVVRGGKAPVRMAPETVQRRIVADLIPIPPLPREPVVISPPQRIPRYRMRPSFRFNFPRVSENARPLAIPDAVGDKIRADIERQAADISERFLSSLTVDEGVSPGPVDTVPLQEFLVRDTGTLSAEVVIPTGRKRAVQGYLHIPYAWGGQINTPDTLCMNNIRILADIMNRFTNIRTEPYEHRIRLDGGGEMRSYPVIYIAVCAPFELTDDEVAGLGMHMGSGCLIIFDNVAQEDRLDLIGESVKKFTDKLLNKSTWGAQMIPSNHPLYHCFFDIPAPLPGGGSAAPAPLPEHLRFVGYFSGRKSELAVVYCSKGLCRPLVDPRNEEIRRLAVNMVVFALTRYREWYFPETGELRYVAEKPFRSW